MQNRNKSLLTAVCLFFMGAALFADGDCYSYDRWGDIEHSPDAYTVEHVYVADELGTGKALNAPQGLYCDGNYIYVVDTGNNRILQLSYSSDRKLSVYRIIDSFNSNGKVTETFNAPSDIYVDKKGTMYIADTNNARVVKISKDLEYMLAFTTPDDPTYDKSLSFLPTRVVADVSGRAYVIARNVNKGFIKYESDGSFTNFWGASEVNPSALDLLWKKIASRAQREQMESFVPTEFSNVYEDSEGFLYAVLKTFDQWQMETAKPIRRLNALGQDILIKNAKQIPVGDLTWNYGSGAIYDGPSRFEDVTVLENEVYMTLDGTRGRIFAYNNQGYLLYCFGGKGNHAGFFKGPVAIDHIGRDLFVLDSQDCTITVFSPTNYGNLIYDALENYASGFYNESGEIWKKVMQLNANYDLAYVGLGKTALRNEDYEGAMEYFAHKKDRKEYSKAFILYRKQWFEKNIGWIFGIVFLLVIIYIVCSIIKKMKQEVAYYELFNKKD